MFPPLPGWTRLLSELPLNPLDWPLSVLLLWPVSVGVAVAVETAELVVAECVAVFMATTEIPAIEKLPTVTAVVMPAATFLPLIRGSIFVSCPGDDAVSCLHHPLGNCELA